MTVHITASGRAAVIKATGKDPVLLAHMVGMELIVIPDDEAALRDEGSVLGCIRADAVGERARYPATAVVGQCSVCHVDVLWDPATAPPHPQLACIEHARTLWEKVNQEEHDASLPG